MTGSVFSTLIEYLRDVFRGVRSVMGSCLTALPYLLNVKSGDLRKEVTEQYPDPVSSRTPDDLPPRTRGLLFNDIERCTGCKECERVCPVRCITVENELGADAAKIWVSVFDIDFARCTFCGLCVEACQPASLVHTRQYEGAVFELPDLVASFGRGRVTPEQRTKWAALRQAKEEAGELIL
jgi:formate hydrogenlyase subunit 6/NADH:ubiquinone oxidoreductase subunit I